MRPDPAPAPLAAAAARRHQLTRAKAIQALRELDRAGHPHHIHRRRRRSRDHQIRLYTQPDIRSQIQQLRSPATHRPAAAIPAAQRATDASLRARLTIALERNRQLAEENTRSATSLPARSATSGSSRTRSGTIQSPETTLTTPPPPRQRHCLRRDSAGHSPG